MHTPASDFHLSHLEFAASSVPCSLALHPCRSSKREIFITVRKALSSSPNNTTSSVATAARAAVSTALTAMTKRPTASEKNKGWKP